MKLIPIFCAVGAFVVTSTGLLGQGFGDAGGDSGAGPSFSDRSSGGSASGGTGAGGLGVIVGENYVLKPSDVVSVEIFQEEDLNKQVRIEGDGTIALALVGKVKVAGMTVAEAQSLVTELYNRDFLVDPQVSLLVTSFSPKIVHVLGQVNSPGVVQIPPDRDLTLTEAIAAVRGVSRLGNPKAITIKRVAADGRAQQMEVNFNRIVTDPDVRDITLQEGDTIWIPERLI